MGQDRSRLMSARWQWWQLAVHVGQDRTQLLSARWQWQWQELARIAGS